jgi:hypothetical protein
MITVAATNEPASEGMNSSAVSSLTGVEEQQLQGGSIRVLDERGEHELTKGST